MSLDYQLLLYDPIYNALGVDGLLDGITPLRIFDKTDGFEIPDRNGIQTVRPVAFVRTAELELRNIDIGNLPETLLTFNNNTWRIKATRQVPSPNGENDGQTMLILLSEG